MSTRKQSKLEVLNLINSHKELLFGKFSDTLESQDKIACWDEIAAKAKDVGLLKPTQGGKHFREVTWQNWRKRAVDKRDKSRQTGSSGGPQVVMDEADELVLEIIGRRSPVLDGINVPEPSGSDSSSVDAPENNDEESFEASEDGEIIHHKHPREKPGPKSGRSAKLDFLAELKAERMQEQLEICKREKHMQELQIFKLEKELRMGPSEFTRKFHVQEATTFYIDINDTPPQQ